MKTLKNFKLIISCLLLIITTSINAQRTCEIIIDSVVYDCTGDAIIYTTAISDTPSYTVNFTPATPLGGGAYSVSAHTGFVVGTINTASGCSNSITVTINEVTLGTDTMYICDTFMYDILAPFGATSYLWNTGSTDNFIVTNMPGMYYCACTYPSCGIVYDTTYFIARTLYYMPDPFHPTSYVSICIGDTTTLFAGFGGATYEWSLMDRGLIVTLPDTTESIDIFTTGTYTCKVTDECGNEYYLYFVVSNAGCYALVWPGDAGADGIADMYDFLYIASAFGDTGTVRAGATSTWIGQNATDWSTYAWGWSPVNAKHSDCDGNGVVDYLDFAPLIANYGSVHMRTEEDGSRTDNPLIPNVTLHANYDTCGINTTVNVDIQLGDATTPIDSIASIVFEFFLDPSMIDTSSVNINYAGSWLGTIGTNMISFQKNLFSNARLDMGASRIDGTNRNGFGKLATVSFVTTDNLSGLASCPLNIGRYLAITNSGDTVELDAINDTLFIDPNKTTGIAEIKELETKLTAYPNPSKDILNIKSVQFDIDAISLMNIMGEKVYNQEINEKETILNTSNFEKGIYILEIEVKGNKVHKKIEIYK